MAIKGLTTDRREAYPSLGTLRKGAAKPEQGNRPGADLTYFRFDTTNKGAARIFASKYGDQPREINVLLPYLTTGENFEAWNEEWVAGGLVHRCDGEQCVLWHDKATGTFSDVPKPCPELAKPRRQRNFKPVGRLTVIVKEFQRLARVTVLTTSLHDIMTLQENLQAVEMLTGRLRGIPFKLCRKPRMVSTPTGDGKRARREKWLLSIEPDPVWVTYQLAAMERAATPLLSAPASAEFEAPEDDGNGDEHIAGPTGPEGDDAEYRDIDEDTGEVLSPVEQEPAPGEEPDFVQPVAASAIPQDWWDKYDQRVIHAKELNDAGANIAIPKRPATKEEMTVRGQLLALAIDKAAAVLAANDGQRQTAGVGR